MEILAGYLVEVLMVVVTVLIGVAVKYGKEKLDIDKQSALNNVINEAVEAGIQYAEHQLEKQAKRLTYSTEDVFKREAVEYVAQGVPKALKHFGITPARIEAMVESRIVGKLEQED